MWFKCIRKQLIHWAWKAENEVKTLRICEEQVVLDIECLLFNTKTYLEHINMDEFRCKVHLNFWLTIFIFLLFFFTYILWQFFNYLCEKALFLFFWIYNSFKVKWSEETKEILLYKICDIIEMRTNQIQQYFYVLLIIVLVIILNILRD